jgi:hypothetical protein
LAGAAAAQAPVASPLRVSVASTVSPGCRGLSPAQVTQRNTEAQLRGAGVTVSNVHNARISVDIDCVAVDRESGPASVAVHQCVAFSEVVSAPSNSDKAMLASTWRNCQSYTCGTARCGALIRTGLQGLIDAFLSDWRMRQANGGRPRPIEQRPQGANDLAAFTAARQRVDASLFFSVYILVCLTQLFHWQFRRPLYPR